MKSLLVFAFIAMGAHAENWFPMEKPDANTTYADKQVCESSESAACWEVSACSSDECSVQEVDDLNNPKFRKENETACNATLEDCSKLLDGLCAEGEALVAADLSHVYCAVLDGYHKKRAVVPDTEKVKAKRDKEAAAKKAEDERKAKRDQRVTELKDCIGLVSPTAKQTGDCLKVLAREVLRDELKE